MQSGSSGVIRGRTLAIPVLLLGLVQGTCARFDGTICEDDLPGWVRPSGWTVETHCDIDVDDPEDQAMVDDQYALVFDDTVVHRFEISISAESHDAMYADLDENYAVTTIEDLDGLPTPIWVPATVRFGGKTWTHVGMRYKGHSSLSAAWKQGMEKLSFALEFDQYEQEHPETRNQRFYGFQKLNFSNAFNDPSLIRDRIGGEVFRAGGVPAARSSFAAVFMDWGGGPFYMGLYTIIEDPCDRMMDQQIGDGSGSLYKPWGEAARWLDLDVIGEDQVDLFFDTCMDDLPADHSDVIEAVRALHAERDRPDTWQEGLEARLDVAEFLKALALNRVMMNWDSYGCMHHNYYVYANPLDGGRFLWIPWDLNESMLDRGPDSCPEPGSVMLDEIVTPDPADEAIDAEWPLIRLLLSDPDYSDEYRTELRIALDVAFAADPLIERMNRYHDLVAPWVVGPEAEEDWPFTTTSGIAEEFEASLTTGTNALEPHVLARRAAVEAALAP